MAKGKRAVDMKYYNIMGVSVDVTEEQLKKAYRKKALQLHPDKRGNSREAQEEFTEMKHAYDVLSDPKRREIYDSLGEEGLKLMEDMGSMDPEELMKVAMKSLFGSGSSQKCCISSIFLFVCTFLLLIPIFWCLRIDETVEWNWASVFTPLWILDALIFCCVGFKTTSPDEEDDEDRESFGNVSSEQDRKASATLKRLRKGFSLIKCCLFLLLQVFIVLKLNHTVDWSIFIVLIPYYCLEGFLIIEKFIASKMLWKNHENTMKNAPKPDIEKEEKRIKKFIINSFVHSIFRIILGILIGLRIDEIITVSWWIVFMPIWILIGLDWIRVFGEYYTNKKAYENYLKHTGQNRPPQPSTTSDDDENVNDENRPPSFTGALCTNIGLLILLSPFFLLTIRLQSDDFSSFYVVLPWFIMVGLIMLIIFCSIVCFSSDDFDTEHEGEEVMSPPENDERVHVGNYESADDRV